MPPERNSQSSKIQLMLYKRLLDGLISRTEPFDFLSHWSSLGCDPTKPFSKLFRAQVELLTAATDLEANAASATCLADMIPVWVVAIEDLGVGPTVEDKLSLVYVLQARQPSAFLSRSAPMAPAAMNTVTGLGVLNALLPEDVQVSLALEQSLLAESILAPVPGKRFN